MSTRQTFQFGIQRARDIGQIATFLTDTTLLMPIDDLLRWQVVQCVSALDACVHDIVLVRAQQLVSSGGVIPRALAEFKLSLEDGLRLGSTLTLSATIEEVVRKSISRNSYQKPQRISEGLSLIGETNMWARISTRLGLPSEQVITQLDTIVDRRNKIVHEADMSPTYSLVMWPITATQAEEAVDFVDKVGLAILDELGFH